VFRVLSEISSFYSRYAVMGDWQGVDGYLIEEFSKQELLFLSKFIHIAGVQDDNVEVAVYRVTDLCDQILVTSYISLSYASMSTEDIDERRKQGYLFEGESYDGTLRLFSPRLTMQYGASILVTDAGSLVYLDSELNKRIVLGDFCNSICDFSLQSDSVVYVIDRRISDISENFCSNCEGATFVMEDSFSYDVETALMDEYAAGRINVQII